MALQMYNRIGLIWIVGSLYLLPVSVHAGADDVAKGDGRYVGEKAGWIERSADNFLENSFFMRALGKLHKSFDDPTRHHEIGIIESLTGYKYNDSVLARTLGVKFGGWLEVGFSGNTNTSKNSYGNGPVTFNDESNAFNLHQVYAYVEKEVDTTSNTVDFGLRADLLYGADARFVTTSNFDTNILNNSRHRKLVFPQAYAEVFLPIGSGLTARLGHFYALAGYEVVFALSNFFFSHAYAMQYGEPFTHTGGYLGYSLTENMMLEAGAVTGWDAFFDQPINFLGRVTYTPDDESFLLTFSLITGDIKTAGSMHNHNRTMYSMVFKHDITSRLHYVLQHDLGVESKALNNRSAEWYGVNQYLFYDIGYNLAAGLRMEWFRDADGMRVNDFSDNYIGVTGSLNYRPIDGVVIRPEIRYDCTTQHSAFNNFRDHDQILLSVSSTFRF